MAEVQTATKNPKQVEEQKHKTEERDMQVHKWTHRVLKRAECFPYLGVMHQKTIRYMRSTESV